MRLLLISNSYSYDNGYLDHCANVIGNFFLGLESVLFIPYALRDYDGYSTLACDRFKLMDIDLLPIHKTKNPNKAIKDAHAVFVGGGNTFRLLNKLYGEDLITPIKEKVLMSSMPYLGISAGANIASPTIKTTNDMPIVYPPSFNSLNLIRFQINPHYCNPDPSQKKTAETRESRIKDFLDENDSVVLGLREDCWLRVEDNFARLGGNTGARLFIKGQEPREIEPNTDVSFLL